MITIICTKIMDVHRKYNGFVSVHTSAQLGRLAWPAEPIFLTPKVLMGPCKQRRQSLLVSPSAMQEQR